MDKNVFNKVGSLTVLRAELNRYGIYRFDRFKEIAEFKKNYNNEINKCLELKTTELKSEIEDYKRELEGCTKDYNELINARKLQLLNQIEKNERFINKKSENSLLLPLLIIKRNIYKIQNKRLKVNLNDILQKPYVYKQKNIKKIENLIEKYTNNFKEEIEKRSENDVSNILYIINTLKKLDSIYYGAIGELKAEKELSKLPKAYYIINDYQLKFNPPIYDKRNNDRIYSIQVDHIVIGPTGVFLIETKNWNQKSIRSLDLFSPIKQLKRSSFALFVYLNDLVGSKRLNTFKLNWGNKQISVNNVLLMTNETTHEKFQFVRVVTLNTIMDFTPK